MAHSELIENTMERFDSLVGGGASSISKLLERVKELTEANEEYKAENTALQARIIEIQGDREDMTKKCTLYEKRANENSVEMSRRQCDLAEAAKEKAKASALAANNTDLKRENAIYRAELENTRREVYGFSDISRSNEKLFM